MATADAIARHRLLRRYLLDGERVVTAVHQHWAKVAEPVATALASLVLALWLDAVIPASTGHLADVIWWLWLVVVVRAAWLLLGWRHDWFVATDKRLILTYGLLTQKVAMMPLSKVTDMSYNRSLLGRIFGFGTSSWRAPARSRHCTTSTGCPTPTTPTARSVPRSSGSRTTTGS